MILPSSWTAMLLTSPRRPASKPFTNARYRCQRRLDSIPRIADRLDQVSFPHPEALRIEQDVRSEERGPFAAGVHAFIAAFCRERRRVGDDSHRSFEIDQQSGSRRAEMGQIYEGAPVIQERAPREVVAGRRQARLTVIPVDAAKARFSVVLRAGPVGFRQEPLGSD